MSEERIYLPSARRPRPGRPRKVRPEPEPSAPVPELEARLKDLDRAAAYLGVSIWTVRDLEAAGTLQRVRIPLGNGGELRKVLFDRQDLDRLIDLWKDRHMADRTTR